MSFRANPAMLAEGYNLPGAIMRNLHISREALNSLVFSGLVHAVDCAGFPYIDLRSLALYYATHEPNPVMHNLVVKMLSEQMQPNADKVTSLAKKTAIAAKKAYEQERRKKVALKKQEALIDQRMRELEKKK